MSVNHYAEAGVNVSLGDRFSAYCGAMCRGSYQNSDFVEVLDFSKGHFRGRRGYRYKNLPNGYIESAGSDGIGTKTIITSAAGSYFWSAYDLLAMVGGDFTRDGGLPLIFLNHLDVASLGDDIDSPAFQSAMNLMEGLERGAKDQAYVLLGGETAELNDCVTSENKNAPLKYNWGGVMIGVIHPDKFITGDNIQYGDAVIALRDTTRSNGISLIRKGLRTRYGTEWFANPDAFPSIEEAANPSVLYDRFLAHVNGWTTEDFQPIVKAKLISHLSGGGIKSKFGDDLLFPRGMSARLSNLWEPPNVMRDCAKDLGVSDEECYEAWGCGQGALVVVDENDVEAFLNQAKSFGINARAAGRILPAPAGASPRISVTSGFTGDVFSLKPKS